jgi:thermopsin
MMRARALSASVAFVVLLFVLSPISAFAAGHAPASAPPIPVGPSVKAPPTLSPSASSGFLGPNAAARAATEQRILSELKSRNAPLQHVELPNFNAQVSDRRGLITPTYPHSPAPFGIASYGVQNTTGNASGYILNSQSYEGSVTFNTLSVLYFDVGDPDNVGVQLNTVASNITLFGDSNYSFWTQNVINYSPRTSELQLFDNIWNFSSPTFYMSPNVFNSTGPNGTLLAPIYYGANGPVLNISMPFTVNLFINLSTTNVGGFPDDIVYFNYSIVKLGSTVEWGSYDYATFNSQNPSSPTATLASPEFQLNGFTPTGSGFLPYESELVLCGPYDGGPTTVLNLDASLNLWYLNGSTGTYENVPSAFAFGTNTGETIEGATEWFDSSDTVHVGAGPTLPFPLWNASPTAAAGHIDLTGTVTPDTSFVFLNTGTVFNQSYAGYAPVPVGGAIDYQVPAANYTGEILMSNYDPVSFTTNLSDPASWNIGVALTADVSKGIYTPLIAYSNSQLAELAVSGAGTLGNPYELPHDADASLDPIFGSINDYAFPEFPGLLLAWTTAYVQLNDSSSFHVDFAGDALSYMQFYGYPTSNDLQFELYATAHVSITNTSDISGWISYNQGGLPLASVMLWNATSTLLAGNVFWSQGTTLQLYGGTANTIWGNWFENDPSLADPAVAPLFFDGTDAFGPQVFENGDLIFNNVFLNEIPAYSPATTIFLDTAYSTFNSTWSDAWNVSASPASTVWVVNGIALSGSILGGSYVGGNLWWDYAPGASALPFGGDGLIAVGGDWLPLVGDSVTFSETGLPSGDSWGFQIDGITVFASTPTIVMSLYDGSFAYSVFPVAGYSVRPANGTLVLAQAPASVAVTFTWIAAVYALMFTESGLPTSTTWQVTVNGAIESASAVTISFNETNGTYTWSVAPIAGLLLADGSGTALVDGANVSLSVQFLTPAARQYTIAFVETGLPAGSSWTVTLEGLPITSSLDVISFTEANGSYEFNVSNVTGYSTIGASGTASVSGTSSNYAVEFTALPVALSGTFTPSTAEVWIDGAEVTPASPGNFSVMVPPGSHAIVVTALGFVTYYNNVTVGVHTPLVVSIALSPTSSPSNGSTSSSGLTGGNLALLAGVATLAVVFLIGMVYFWSRSRRPPMVMKPETSLPASGGSDPSKP